MKWKKEFVEHLSDELQIAQIKIRESLSSWQGSPFKDEKPKHPIELVNEKYPDGWCIATCDEVIKDINKCYDKCYDGSAIYYGVISGKCYSSFFCSKTLIPKQEYLQLTGREPLQRDWTEIKHEPTTIHIQLPNVEHYGGNTNPFPPIRIIQHYNLSFELGNVIKYVLRDKGSKVEDLKKAIDYLNFEICKYENK